MINRFYACGIFWGWKCDNRLRSTTTTHFQVPSIQQTAALALSRIAAHSEELARAVVDCDVLPHLVFSLADQNVSLFVCMVRGSRHYVRDTMSHVVRLLRTTALP